MLRHCAPSSVVASVPALAGTTISLALSSIPEVAKPVTGRTGLGPAVLLDCGGAELLHRTALAVGVADRAMLAVCMIGCSVLNASELSDAEFAGRTASCPHRPLVRVPSTTTCTSACALHSNLYNLARITSKGTYH